MNVFEKLLKDRHIDKGHTGFLKTTSELQNGTKVKLNISEDKNIIKFNNNKPFDLYINPVMTNADMYLGAYIVRKYQNAGLHYLAKPAYDAAIIWHKVRDKDGNSWELIKGMQLEEAINTIFNYDPDVINSISTELDKLCVEQNEILNQEVGKPDIKSIKTAQASFEYTNEEEVLKRNLAHAYEEAAKFGINPMDFLNRPAVESHIKKVHSSIDKKKLTKLTNETKPIEEFDANNTNKD